MWIGFGRGEKWSGDGNRNGFSSVDGVWEWGNRNGMGNWKWEGDGKREKGMGMGMKGKQMGMENKKESSVFYPHLLACRVHGQLLGQLG